MHTGTHTYTQEGVYKEQKVWHRVREWWKLGVGFATKRKEEGKNKNKIESFMFKFLFCEKG